MLARLALTATLALLSAIALPRLSRALGRSFAMASMLAARPTQPAEWRAVLDSLPEGGRIPAVFVAHGQPALLHPKPVSRQLVDMLGEDATPGGRQEAFLNDLGPALLRKYAPKAVVIFSAHWDEDDIIRVSDWRPRNPILYDFYGFPRELCASASDLLAWPTEPTPRADDLDFVSHGDEALSARVVDLLERAGIPARLNAVDEPRAVDGKTGEPATGLDHGCLVPLRLMFGDRADDFPLPVVQVSIWGGRYSPEREQALGAAVRPLRDEGVLVLSGGLTYHNLRRFEGFRDPTALDRDFHDAVLASVEGRASIAERRRATAALERHAGFREAHPKADRACDDAADVAQS